MFVFLCLLVCFFNGRMKCELIRLFQLIFCFLCLFGIMGVCIVYNYTVGLCVHVTIMQHFFIVYITIMQQVLLNADDSALLVSGKDPKIIADKLSIDG